MLDKRLTPVRNMLNDFWILLDKVALHVDDTLWVDDFTTAHEALCDLADAYDPEVASEFRRRLEDGGDGQ